VTPKAATPAPAPAAAPAQSAPTAAPQPVGVKRSAAFPQILEQLRSVDVTG
jgi:hypothetical protein